MFLHGVLLALAGASVLLLCLCLSELRFPWRRTPQIEALRRRSQNPLLAARRGESLYSLRPVRLWDTESVRADRSSREPTSPSVWPAPGEQGQRGSEMLAAR